MRPAAAVLALALLNSLFASVAAQAVVQVQKDGSPDDPGLARYISRPDIRAPKWDLNMRDPESNSPGHWFVAPYRGFGGQQSDQAWVGPFIYDGQTGELIWSGAAAFNSNVADFRISNVNGEKLMTFFTWSNQLVVVNTDYTVRQTLAPERFNKHEFHVVENGTRALIVRSNGRSMSPEESQKVGLEGEVRIASDGIAELDVTKDGWPSVFEWNSKGQIDVDESTHHVGQPGFGDYVHINSIDKTPQGDYIVSARHTDALYKISGKDKSILWRLGGRRSDFRMDDLVFSRQHNVRYRGQNETHLLLSILDNAKGEDDQPASHDFSRGLLISVDEANMVATMEAHYDHPRESIDQRRGNCQLLPNGNVLMGWSERAMQSEHTPDGQVIWDAMLQVDWMGSYRNYKFEFVGEPAEPPAAVSRASGSESAVTDVHVSWNGATEVATWDLYRCTADGAITALVATAPQTGFETRLTFDGYAKYVLAAAKDAHGNRLGATPVIQTVNEDSLSAQVIAEGERWAQDVEPAQTSTRIAIVFIAGALVGVLSVFALRHCGPSLSMDAVRRLLRPDHKYTQVPQT